MYMTSDEICVRYRQAKDKKAQIRILADLNAASKQEIISVLEAAGIPLPEKPARKTPDKPKSEKTFKFDTDLAKQLYDKGLIDAEISELVGVSNSTIWKWRKHQGLPCQKKNPSRTTKGPVSTMKKLAETHCEPTETMHLPLGNPSAILTNPVLLKLQKLFDMVSQEDSPKVAGQYLDLMISMLMEEVERITTAENRKPLPGGQTGEQPR